MDVQVNDQEGLVKIGMRLGTLLNGGEVIELVGDVGAGKTTLAKALAQGMGISEPVSSPSYTLSQIYEAPSNLRMAHYDFYRLDNPGILANELAETMIDDNTVTVIEWGDILSGILPKDHLSIRITPLAETSRKLTFTSGGNRSDALLEQLR